MPSWIFFNFINYKMKVKLRSYMYKGHISENHIWRNLHFKFSLRFGFTLIIWEKFYNDITNVRTSLLPTRLAYLYKKYISLHLENLLITFATKSLIFIINFRFQSVLWNCFLEVFLLFWECKTNFLLVQ